MRNVPHRLQHLNTWFPAGSAVRGRLDHRALLEEVCYWGQVSRVHSLTQLLVHSLCLAPAVKDVISRFPMPATCWHALAMP